MRTDSFGTYYHPGDDVTELRNPGFDHILVELEQEADKPTWGGTIYADDHILGELEGFASEEDLLREVARNSKAGVCIVSGERGWEVNAAGEAIPE